MKIFKYWKYNEYGHYSSKFPKRKRKYNKNPYKPRKCLFTTDEELDACVEKFLSKSDDESDEIGFVSIKKVGIISQRKI